MPIQPPDGCRDPRLWTAARELAEQHVADDGYCVSCGTRAPCRRAEAAEDAMRRAMPPAPVPAVEDPGPVAPLTEARSTSQHPAPDLLDVLETPLAPPPAWPESGPPAWPESGPPLDARSAPHRRLRGLRRA